MSGEQDILETTKKLATDEFLAGIEVTWIKHPILREEVARLLTTRKMTVAYGANRRIGPTGQNINDTNEEERQAALTSLKQGIDEAYELGAQSFTFCSNKYYETRKEGALAHKSAHYLAKADVVCIYQGRSSV